MRITIGSTQYRWTPGSRTINIWTDVPYIGEGNVWSRWLETDAISFGYDKPDNSTTPLEALAVILRRMEDCEHPSLDDCGRTCHHLECPDCGILIDTSDVYLVDDEPPYGSSPEER